MRWLRNLSAAMAGLAMLWAGAAPAQITVQKIKVHGASLEANLEGNSADRDVYVVLPASYAKSPKRRYPVLFYLHGYFSTAESYMSSTKIEEAANAAFAAGPEMIIVVPDTFTRNAGSMYSNSPTVGDFEDFVARDLVAYVDGHYRTIARRESRGLSGHSMGGYGTLRIGMKHPEVFSSLYAMSACCLSARTTTIERAKKMDSLTPEEAAKADFFTRADIAASAAWSPAPEKPPFFADSGAKGDAIDPNVTARWAANAPIAMLPQYLPALRSMHAIAMDVGDKDFLFQDDLTMHQELTRFGVAHDWAIYDGDHVNRVPIRFRAFVLPFFQKNLAVK